MFHELMHLVYSERSHLERENYAVWLCTCSCKCKVSCLSQLKVLLRLQRVMKWFI